MAKQGENRILSILEAIWDFIWPNHYPVENLEEMATVGRDSKIHLLMQVNPDIKHEGNEYFKVYNAIEQNPAKKMNRISFWGLRYVKYKEMYGKKPWFLNSGERKDLVDFLRSKNANTPEYTNWQVAILAHNNEKGLDYQKTKENLLSDKELKYPNFLPFDLPMPDYTKLPMSYPN